MRALLAAACSASIALAASPGFAAPSRDACVAASEDAQTFKLKGQLRAAREKLLVCSNEACPKVVKQDCGGWLDEVDHAMPTLVFSVHDARGGDLTDVRISVDGVLVLDHLDGKAVAVDLGQHTVRFETQGLAPKEEKVVAREGEKNRILVVSLGDASTPAVPSTTTESKDAAQTPPKDTPRTGPSPATWVVGGLGLATLAAAGIVGAFSLNERSSLYDRCGAAGTCAQSDVDAVYRLYDVAYSGAAIGSALVVTSVVLFFVTKPGRATSAAFVVGPTLGGLVAMGRF